MNIDAKLLKNMLANGINNIFKKYILYDQVGFIPVMKNSFKF